jgi:integrase/recombinase XerD
MNGTPSFAALLERFFTERLMRQRQSSPHTIACYRDTFRLLLQYSQKALHKSPSDLELTDVNTELIDEFLEHLEKTRAVTARTRNLRLTAIRSFFRFVAFYTPELSAHIQRVLAIPTKRCSRPMVEFLTRPEIEVLLGAPDRGTWLGRRDHCLLLLAVQTGLRLSELTSLTFQSIVVGTGAHVRCEGKGRKERCTPLTTSTVSVLKSWMKEPRRQQSNFLFSSNSGGRLSADSVQYLLAKYVAIARDQCPSLKRKHVTVHCLRHSTAMGLLESGVESSVIALWLGHESVETTQVYLHAHLALKEAALAKTTPLNAKPGRFRPADHLLQFLSAL